MVSRGVVNDNYFKVAERRRLKALRRRFNVAAMIVRGSNNG